MGQRHVDNLTVPRWSPTSAGCESTARDGGGAPSTRRPSSTTNICYQVGDSAYQGKRNQTEYMITFIQPLVILILYGTSGLG